MAEDSTGDKTEAATSRHLDQARDAGRVPISREATVFASMAAVVVVLAYQAHATMRDLLPTLSQFLAHADGSWVAGSDIAVRGVLTAILPYLAAHSDI